MRRQGWSATMVLGLWVLVVSGGVAAPAMVRADTRDDDGGDGDDAWEIQRDSPVVLHASALSYELDGELDRALELLRAAIELAPDDGMIAFDLARIAFEADSDELESDVASFLAREPEAEDARLLKAYIMLHLGQRQAADEQLAAVLAAFPDNAEAARLRDVVMHVGIGDTPSSWLSASLRVGVELDSNVTVVPDSPTRVEGVRIATDGTVTVVPLRDPTELTISGAFRIAPHLNDRDTLELFDVASAAALVRVRHIIGPVIVTVQGSGTQILINSFRHHFMQDLFGDAEVRYPVANLNLQLAIFGRAGYRDYGVLNLEADPDDRDGVRFSAGGLASWRLGDFSVGAQASFESADTDGYQQRELGLQLGAYLRWRSMPWQLRLGFNYALRSFPDSRNLAVQDASSRLDNRFSGSLDLTVALYDHVGAFASVVWIKNLSNAAFAGDYGYDRVMAQVGVLTQW